MPEGVCFASDWTDWLGFAAQDVGPRSRVGGLPMGQIISVKKKNGSLGCGG